MRKVVLLLTACMTLYVYGEYKPKNFNDLMDLAHETSAAVKANAERKKADAFSKAAQADTMRAHAYMQSETAERMKNLEYDRCKYYIAEEKNKKQNWKIARWGFFGFLASFAALGVFSSIMDLKNRGVTGFTWHFTENKIDVAVAGIDTIMRNRVHWFALAGSVFGLLFVCLAMQITDLALIDKNSEEEEFMNTDQYTIQQHHVDKALMRHEKQKRWAA
jgi:hypothetical protein